MSTLTQSDRIAGVTTPLGDNVLVLRGLSVTEAMNRLPTFELDLLSEKEKLDPKALLGKTVSIRLNVKDNKERFFHGHMIQFSRGNQQDRYFPYKATVVPWLWFLTRRSNCRIFQNQSVPQIVEKVFKEYGFDFEPRLFGSYTPWEYCVQYRETDFNFVCRLMEQEGISFFYKYEKSRNVLILGDSADSYKSFPDYDSISYRPPGQHGLEKDTEHIREVVSQMNHISGKYTHTDYNFETPKTPLRTLSALPGEYEQAEHEVFDYPGEYEVHEDGQDWAKIRMEEIHAQIQTITGWGDARGLATGHVFTLTEPDFPEHGGKYLITSVRHTLRTNEYESGRDEDGTVYACQFLAQPAAKVYRPGRVTPKPRIGGIQTAVVTGPPGEEIHTDKYGRIKVQFHWDREGRKNENSSCWVRVAQIWAGRQWGASFTPRIGQEVVIDFLEGDPDLPVVIGSLYNGDQMPPYLGSGPDPKHPDDPKVSGIKTNSTKGGGGYNELRFDDTKGKEQVFMHSEKDLDIRVKSDERKTIGGSVNLTVGFEDKNGELHGFIKEKVFRSKVTYAKKTVAVHADDQYFAFIGPKGSACKQFMNASGQYSNTASDSFTVKAGTKILMEGETEICLKSGPSFIKITPAGIWINGPMIYVNSGGVPTPVPGVEYVEPLEPDAADNSKPGYPSNT